jgi:fructose-1,6-bisphosphatase/inositol monophosphatase family enzyme
VPVTSAVVDGESLLGVMREAVQAVHEAITQLDDWGPAGTRPGQYRSDLAADAAALEVFADAGWGVLSEESGLREAGRDLLAVIDPIDGSTNAGRGLPWYATSICVLDAEGPAAAIVVNQSSGVTYEAVRGGGATRDGETIEPSTCTSLRSAFVGLSGYPSRYLGWRQYRSLGAAALDICAVADGRLDAFIDAVDVPGSGALGCWDYLGALLVCREAGAVVVDLLDRDLVVRDPQLRRTPVAAATPDLLDEVVAARLSYSQQLRTGG